MTPTKQKLVLQYYPNAKVELRPTGKEYYQVINNGTVIGQGKTKDNAWSAAWKNIND